MRDSIDRQAARSAICDACGQIDCDKMDVCKKLDLPSAQPGWIPCSERLPDDTEEVLITYIVNGNQKKRYVETATYYGEDGWSSPCDEYRVIGTQVEVIAWMPLPNPYKGGIE